MDTPDQNVSTDHQPKGAARNPSDTLNRENQDVAPGQRQWNADSQQDPDTTENVSALPSGMADDGSKHQEGAKRGEDQAEEGSVDDGGRSEGSEPRAAIGNPDAAPLQGATPPPWPPRSRQP